MHARTVGNCVAAALAACLLLAGTHSAVAAPAPADKPLETGRFLVTVEAPRVPLGEGRAARALRRERAATASRLISKVASRHPLRLGQRIPAGAVFAAAPSPGESPADLRRELLADPLVAGVEPEFYLQLRGYVPNDPAYLSSDPNAPGGDRRQWNLIKSHFEDAWTVTDGSQSTVAILDTGVSSTQPDLTQLAGEADHDATPTGATSDENGHGTHVAGLACANSDNGYGMASAGFDCRIIAEKLDVSGNNLTLGSIIAAVYHAANNGARVLNMSFGSTGASDSLRQAINYAWGRDVVMVSSASNQSVPDQGYPANYLQPVGTAFNPATCNDGDATTAGCARGLVVTMANYNSVNGGAGYGTGVSVAAYGDSYAPLKGIFSTWPANSTTREDALCLVVGPFPCAPRTVFDGDDRFAYLFGTSMAAPQVSGLAALIRSLYPDLTAGEVVRAIKASASGKGKWTSPLGWGIIDAAAALQLTVISEDKSAPSSRVKTRRRSAKRRFPVKVTSADSDPAGKPASGVDKVAIYVSKNGRRFRHLRTIRRSKFKFKGSSGDSYRFYSRAVDKAGNRESAPDKPDAATRVRGR